jgi:prepilin-type N-terminal cleavage/methylation domain-containing protein
LELPVRRRRGFSLPEILTAIVIMAIIAAMMIPQLTELRTRSGLRAARMQLVAALSAARAAAVQKGKPASVQMAGSAIVVNVVSGLRNESLQIFGPLRLDRTTGASLFPVSGAPTTIVYDARGLISPASATTTRYALRMGRMSDTVCLTGSGAVMIKGCVL